MSGDTAHVRQDKEGNIYAIPSAEINEFDNDCDEAVYAEHDEAIGLWIDIKTKWKRFIQE
jgi:hypothetical protein